MIKEGDTIGIIALSGDCDREKIKQAAAHIQNLGYNVKLSKNIFDCNRYLAGIDEDKITELEAFFSDSQIKLILCARGGYGAIRLINKINYDVIKSNPKPFCGFSDVTALLLMIYKKTGMVTVHSPMAQSLSNEPKNSFNQIIRAVNNCSYKNLQTQLKSSQVYSEGSANGILWGGNLSTIVSLCGQEFLPEEDFIFFTEDVNEHVYKIDRMFQQLININKFHNNCRGIILGEFLGVDNPTWLNEYFKELSEKLSVPVLGGFKITHGDGSIVVPIGVQAEINKSILTSCFSG